MNRPLLAPLGAPDSFSALPLVEHDYRFSVQGLPEGGEIPWEITDARGSRQVVRGTFRVQEGQGTIRVSLPAGFYELHVPATKQVFGLSVLREPAHAPDPFFAIEALLLTALEEAQESCLRFLERHHISFVRDWAAFHQLHPARGTYLSRRDVLYARMASHHIQAAYAFAHFPSWLGPIPIRKNSTALPKTLLDFDTAVLTMYDSRRTSAVMVQPLNEFDSLESPSEGFLAPIRATAWALRERPECLLGGAAFCKPAPTPALAQSLEGDMLDFIDVFAFHAYGPPEELRERTEGYRRAMAFHPEKAWMPLWITESGKPWERGRDARDAQIYSSVVNNQHPKVEEDMQSALWIVANGVEAKTLGIARFFPFTMAFFQENNSNFGMMDYHRTPLRSLHSYAFAADLLAGKEYVGDPAIPSPDLAWEHLFVGDGEGVVVFYAGKDSHLGSQARAEISRFPAGQGFSLTGEALGSQGEFLPLPEGLAYWVFPADQLSPESLNSSTRNMALKKGAETYRKVPRKASPVILRYAFWKAKEPHYNSFAYFLEGRECVFQVTNLDDQEQEFQPVAILPEGVTLKKPLPEKILLPPRSERELVLELVPGETSTFTIRLKNAKDPLSEIRVPLVLVENLRTVTLDSEKTRERWRENSAGRQTLSYDKDKQALKVYTDFRNKANPQDSNWSFPELTLTPEEQSSHLIAVSFEIMVDPACYDVNAQKWHMLQAGNAKQGTRDNRFHCHGVTDQWKRFTIYISGDEPCSLIRIGMATEAQELTYYLRNLQFHLNP